MKNNYLNSKKRGVALYISVVITGMLILVSYAIINIAIKQLTLTSFSRDSQAALYSASSGIECALFWDLKGGNIYTESPFSTTSPNNINCNNQSPAISRTGGANATSTFQLSFEPTSPYCVVVEVGKSYGGGNLKTRIESRGYNSCDLTNTRRVERAIEVTY